VHLGRPHSTRLALGRQAAAVAPYGTRPITAWLAATASLTAYQVTIPTSCA
jgi:hypothetical protein